MSVLSTGPEIIAQDLFVDNTIAQIVTGAKAETPDGRVYRYCCVGSATALVAGSLYQSPANFTNHLRLTVQAAAAVGATSVSLTLGASAAAANQYAGGYLVIHSTGGGFTYRISGHPSAAASATLTVKIEDPIVTALTTSSIASLIHPSYGNAVRGVVINPTTATGAPVGWAVTTVAANDFGWLQTHGPVAALVQGTITIGSPIQASVTTAGAVNSALISGSAPFLGYTLEAGTTAENSAMFGTID